MLFRLLADGVVVLHALFIVFSVLGGLLALRWPKAAFLHLPAAAWGVIVQVVVGGQCPLTPLENYLRERGHEPGIGPSFIDHYITELIYVSDPPDWLHPALGIGVLAINATVYGVVIARWARRRRLAREERQGFGVSPGGEAVATAPHPGNPSVCPAEPVSTHH
jgi:hypothetical protein